MFGHTSFAQEIVFGAGTLAQLGEAVAGFGWRRLMLCTSGSARRGGQVAKVEAALRENLVAVYDHVQPHVPEAQLNEVLALAVEEKADVVIGLGGGSPIGMAKAASAALHEKGLPATVVAIPTTYAGSEMTAVYGVTRTVDGVPRKVTVTNPKIVPRLVIYDPQLTLDLPQDLTATTGLNALAHCVEAIYSITRHPLSTVAALEGARHIARALPRCYTAGDDLDARTEMMLGAHLAGAALASVVMGLHHGLCHVLGGTAGVPHGVANSLILPHAMRFNADAVALQLAQVAEAMGLAREGRSDEALALAAAQWVYDLVGQMKAPQHLRDVGVAEADLPRLARLAAESRTVQNNPKPVTAAQVEEILRAAW